MTLPRLLAGARHGEGLALDEHLAVHGPAAPVGRELVEAVELAGLRGRGGASFPTAVKLRSVATRRGSHSILVNGAEGEPMSAKDRVLLELAPHLVLDGAFAAAAAIGADRVVIAIRADSGGALASVRQALAERPRSRAVTVARIPAAYLAGEESALIQYLDGGPLVPRTVPPLPFERGLRRRPTLVQNPETLAHVALIARRGSAWFREVGTGAHPGSALVSVSGAVLRPGVQEIECGMPLDAVLSAAGGVTESIRAVLIGGYHGAWIPRDRVPSVRLDDDHLVHHGGSLAAGVIVVLGESACPAAELADTMAWLANESAHQCGPCSNGLPAMADLLASMVAGRGPQDGREWLARWSGQITGRGACHLPDGAMRFLGTGLAVFADEIADHEQRGPCAACLRPRTLELPARHRIAA
jgi:NADH:ubiquinone oxidoreductase subunit F (NADH-binding)